MIPCRSLDGGGGIDDRSNGSCDFVCDGSFGSFEGGLETAEEVGEEEVGGWEVLFVDFVEFCEGEGEEETGMMDTSERKERKAKRSV